MVPLPLVAQAPEPAEVTCAVHEDAILSGGLGLRRFEASIRILAPRGQDITEDRGSPIGFTHAPGSNSTPSSLVHRWT